MSIHPCIGLAPVIYRRTLVSIRKHHWDVYVNKTAQRFAVFFIINGLMDIDNGDTSLHQLCVRRLWTVTT